VAGHSAPTLVDLDDDGSLDLVLGSQSGNITYYRRRIDGAFERVAAADDPFVQISVDLFSAPALADLDHDGDLDLVVGGKDGRLAYFRNTGSSTKAHFQPVDRPNGPFTDVVVNGFSKPLFMDLDRDGDLDLVIGDWFGEVVFFRNAGSISNPRFAIAVNVIAVGSFAAPAIAMVDGFLSMVVGSAPGRLVVFRDVRAMVFDESPVTDANLGTVEKYDSLYANAAAVDLNGDGKISLDEFARVLSDTGPPFTNVDEDGVKTLFSLADSDSNGHLDFDEFITWQKSTRSLLDSFLKLDLDHDGVISKDEWRVALGKAGLDWTAEECNESFDGADTNGDGFLDFAEYTVWAAKA